MKILDGVANVVGGIFAVVFMFVWWAVGAAVTVGLGVWVIHKFNPPQTPAYSVQSAVKTDVAEKPLTSGEIKEFMDACNPEGTHGSYCRCVLDTLVQKYDVDDLRYFGTTRSTMTREQIEDAGAGCL